MPETITVKCPFCHAINSLELRKVNLNSKNNTLICNTCYEKFKFSIEITTHSEKIE